MKERRSGNLENAFIVGCRWGQQSIERVDRSIRELHLLADTAQCRVIDQWIQHRDKPHARTYIGKGKVEEVLLALEEQDIDVIIFNDNLSPSQIHQLESILPCKVIDRTQLILDIFAMRARSREGKLQVELAQLEYLLPRVIGKGTSLSRLGGGIGTRGPGETKLETDRRHIRNRMKDIKDQLQKVISHRNRYRDRRKKNRQFLVSLVGYTNAGKSTLLNQLTAADVQAEDQLFATLDPTTRKLQLPSGYKILVTDTVGFIQDLPTALIAAFRSTLEEVKESELILHVIDSTDEAMVMHKQVVEDHIDTLGAGHVPIINVYNKSDQTASSELIIHMQDVYISAHNGQGLRTLLEKIEQDLMRDMSKKIILLPADKGNLIADCRQFGLLKKLDWIEEQQAYRLEVYVRIADQLWEELKPFAIKPADRH